MYFTEMKYFTYNLGALPNWWPAYDSGYPINLTLDGFLNPIFLITLKFLPPFLANNLLVFFFFVINGLSLYAFGRVLKLSRTASLISAITYGFSGVVIRHTPITGIVALMPFLPLSFLCCLKIFQGKIKWFWLWLALLVYSWIGGWAEMIIYALLAEGFFAVYLIIKERKTEGFRFRRAILFFGAVILSVVILLPWFLSVMYFISTSTRSGGMPLSSAGSAPTTFSHLIHMFYPRLSLFYGELLPFFSFSVIDYFLYIGPFSLLLVLASFFTKNKKEKGHLIFFLSLAAGSILMTIKHSPLFWLFHQFPVLRWFRGYWKWSFVIVFSLAILAGYGIDNVRDFFKNRFSRYVIPVLWLATLIIFIGISAITIFDKKIQADIASYGIARYKNTPERIFQRTDDYYQNLIKKMSQSLIAAFSLKNKWLLLSVILWLISLAYITLGKYELLAHQKWRMIAVLITFAGSVLVWTDFYKGQPVSYLKTEPAAAQYLHSINSYRSNSFPFARSETADLPEPYRIYSYTPDQFIAVLSEKYNVNLAEEKERNLFSREIMDQNLHIAFNFDAFFNHQTLVPARLSDMFNLTKRQKQFTKESYLDKTPFNEYVKAFSEGKNLRLLGMLNIKYILTSVELENNLKLVFTTYALNNKLPVFVYENPYFLPRWYFAENVKWADKNTVFEDLKNVADFKKTTIIEKLTLNDSAIITKADPQDQFELQLYAPGKLIMKTKTKNYRFFIFSENRQPFWQVKINGERAPLYVANYLYQAVLAPPGENIIEFRYPNLWEQGLISAASYIGEFFNKF